MYLYILKHVYNYNIIKLIFFFKKKDRPVTARVSLHRSRLVWTCPFKSIFKMDKNKEAQFELEFASNPFCLQAQTPFYITLNPYPLFTTNFLYFSLKSQLKLTYKFKNSAIKIFQKRLLSLYLLLMYI